MKPTKHELALDSLDAMAGLDSVCVFVSEDQRPLRGLPGLLDWRLCGSLSRVLQNGWFVGAKNDTLLLPSDGRVTMPRVFVVGLGPRKALGVETLSSVLEETARVLNKAKAEAVAIEIPGQGVIDDAQRVAAFEKHFLGKFTGRVAIVADKTLRLSA